MCRLKDHIASYSQSVLSLTNLRDDMEAAKLQLEAYSVKLTELISNIGKYCWS